MDEEQEIIESIIQILEQNKKSVDDDDIFTYVDMNIDSWGVDLCDFFLDDIVSKVVKIVKKREKLTKVPCNNIIFEESEEIKEKRMLNRMVKRYNKIYKKTFVRQSKGNNVEVEEINDLSEVSEDETSGEVGSWKELLKRVDEIYNKVKS